MEDFIPGVVNVWNNVDSNPRTRTFGKYVSAHVRMYLGISDTDTFSVWCGDQTAGSTTMTLRGTSFERRIRQTIDMCIPRILQDSTEIPAGAFRARGTPAVLRIVEIMGMEQGREWGVCTMNEFRDYLGLKRFATFEEWNSDKEVAVSRQLHRNDGHLRYILMRACRTQRGGCAVISITLNCIQAYKLKNTCHRTWNLASVVGTQ